MSSDETPKIEPTLTDAPSIAPGAAEPKTTEPAAPKIEAAQTEAPKIEPPKVEAKAEPERIESTFEQKPEPKIEAPTLPPAAQLAEPAAIARLKRHFETKSEPAAAKSRNSRFALLAACVVIASSIGAIGGSLGVAKFGPLFSPAPAPEVTGSIEPKTAANVPMVLGDPPTTLKPPILQDYVLRRVYDGAALIEGRNGIIEVEPGIVAPGLGRIEAIKRQDGRWVVVTARGLIVQR